MLRRFALSLVAFVAAAAVVAPTFGSSTATRLNGTVGPGFTITLKKGTARVTTLKAGSYTFVVRDRSNIHDFALRGPVSRVITTVRFVGTKTVTLRLKAGRYTYVCRPHVSTMKGSFRVT
jgi:plastocyanin